MSSKMSMLSQVIDEKLREHTNEELIEEIQLFRKALQYCKDGGAN